MSLPESAVVGLILLGAYWRFFLPVAARALAHTHTDGPCGWSGCQASNAPTERTTP